MAGIFRVVAQETGVRSEAVPGDSTGPVHSAAAIVVAPVWDLAAAASTAGAASVVAAGASEAVEAAGVAAADAGDRRRS